MESSCNLEIREIIQDGLKEIWKSNTLSDITLLADGLEFSSHKVVLAAASPFFMAMFTGGWTETASNKTVDLKGVSAASLKQLLDFIYTGEMNVNPGGVMGLLTAADQLQILPAVKICSEFMTKHVDIDNCVDVLNISQMHNLEGLENAACDFIAKNFQQVLRCKHHCRLELSDFLYFLDGDMEGEDVVVLDSEMTVFSAILEWLQFDQEKRMTYVEQVMEVVRFQLLSAGELNDIQQNVPFMTSNPACQKFIEDAKAYHQKAIHQRVLVCSKSNRVRSRESILITSQIQAEQIEAWALNPHHTPHEDPVNENWTALQNFPNFDFDRVGSLEQVQCLEMNGFVLVVMVKPSAEEEVHSKLAAFIFDPRFFTWSELQNYDVSKGSQIEETTVCQNNLFVFISHSDDQAKEILKYSFENNTWEHLDYMRPKFARYSVCTYQNQIYIFGIRWTNSSICTYVYNPVDLTWTMKRSGSDDRNLENWKTFVYDNKILHSSVEDDVLSFDIYHPDKDKWNTLWINTGFSDLSTRSQVFMAGDNLFFLDNDDSKPYTSEMTLGRKFCEFGILTFIKHQAIPTSLKEGNVVVPVRIPLSKFMP